MQRKNVVKITTLVRYSESCWSQQTCVRHFSTYRQLQLHYEMFSCEWGLFNSGSSTLRRGFIINQKAGALKLAALLHKRPSHSQYITANCPLVIVNTHALCDEASGGQETVIKNVSITTRMSRTVMKQKVWRYTLTVYMWANISRIKFGTLPPNIPRFWILPSLV
jgi:hypothetical protein